MKNIKLPPYLKEIKGCCFEIEDNTINSIGLDGYRLAFVKKPLVKTYYFTEVLECAF